MTKPREKRPRLRLAPLCYLAQHRSVLERDGWRCQSCGSCAGLEVHHITPRSNLAMMRRTISSPCVGSATGRSIQDDARAESNRTMPYSRSRVAFNGISNNLKSSTPTSLVEVNVLLESAHMMTNRIPLQPGR
jgi:hypothetical protein